MQVEPSLHCPPRPAQAEDVARKAPLAQFRRSLTGGGGRAASIKLCSALKARDISSCEISICDPGPGPEPDSLAAKRHTSVSFGSLPSSCSEDGAGEGEEDEDRIRVQPSSPTTGNGTPAPGAASAEPNTAAAASLLPRPSLLVQHSIESGETTTTDTAQGAYKHVRHTFQIFLSYVRNIFTPVISYTSKNLNFDKNICAQDTSQMPIATALFVATCLGTPAIALTGLKLGMFAAVGGGIMGFATGKMFAEHE